MAKKTAKKTTKKAATGAARKGTARTAASGGLEAKIRKVLETGSHPKLGALATVTSDGRPSVRTMVVHPDGLTLYTSTALDSRKVEQIRRNPAVSLAISTDHTKLESPYIVFDGRGEVLTDRKTKKAYWTSYLEHYFTGPDDPNYAVLKCTPLRIEYMGGKGPEVLSLGEAPTARRKARTARRSATTRKAATRSRR